MQQYQNCFLRYNRKQSSSSPTSGLLLGWWCRSSFFLSPVMGNTLWGLYQQGFGYLQAYGNSVVPLSRLVPVPSLFKETLARPSSTSSIGTSLHRVRWGRPSCVTDWDKKTCLPGLNLSNFTGLRLCRLKNVLIGLLAAYHELLFGRHSLRDHLSLG